MTDGDYTPTHSSINGDSTVDGRETISGETLDDGDDHNDIPMDEFSKEKKVSLEAADFLGKASWAKGEKQYQKDGDYQEDEQDNLHPVKHANKQIFVEPGTMPLPDSGYHSLGVCYENLTVVASGQTKRTVDTAERSFLQSWNFPNYVLKLAGYKHASSTRELISDFYGVVPAGETMLVLGRPGAGCSTLLRAIANERSPFMRVDGHVQYSTIDAKEAAKFYKGEIVFNNEEDSHYPVLSVAQTLAVAHKLKKPAKMQHPQKLNEYALDQTNRALAAFGMPHVFGTKVGNDYIRGVSGGERKRVSLSEMFSTNAAIISWDNCIRGLDSAVALHFLRILKELARSTGQTSIVSIYQGSQEVFDTCFDRVTVIYDGKMVFCGHTEDAAPFFIEQGWYKKARQTVPDFLTACTSISERRVREDYHGPPVPETPEQMSDYFRKSPMFAKLQNEIANYKAAEEASNHVTEFRLAVANSKHKGAGKANPYKANFGQQIAILVVRQVQLVVAAPTTFIIRLGSNVLQSLIVGAIFYKPASDATGSFIVAGGLYFTVLYFAIFSLAELGFYTPAAKIFAEMVIDAPIYAFQTMIFSCLFYFLLWVPSVTWSQSHLTGPSFSKGDYRRQLASTLLFGLSSTRATWPSQSSTVSSLPATQKVAEADQIQFLITGMVATWSPNLTVGLRYGGLNLLIILIAGDFLLPPPLQHRWISWTRRISPVDEPLATAYAFEALLANEFRRRYLTCSATDLIPNGAGYENLANQVCTIIGSVAGDPGVSGLTYINTKFEFKEGNIWRNGAPCLPNLGPTMVVLGSTIIIKDTGGTSGTLFKPHAVIPLASKKVVTRDSENGDAGGETKRPGFLFTFKNVFYTVQVGGADKVRSFRLYLVSSFSRRDSQVLLNNVSGVVESGGLTALMGACEWRSVKSSFHFVRALADSDVHTAGKTTLLNTIAGRQTTGKVEGEMLLDGKPLGETFSRCTGFAQQGDIHDPYATVRECLQFSALLRQTGNRTREEKLAYAEEVIELLELGPIADALIGNAIDWPGRWNESPEAAALQQRIADAAAHPGSNITEETGPFASTFKEQVYELTIRNLKSQYRDGAYYTSILMLSCFYALFCGFYFFRLKHSVQGIQSLSLAILIVIQCAAPIAFETAHFYVHQFDMYLGRERNGIYSWEALVTALLVVEIPVLLASFTLAFLCFYWTAGLESTAQTAGLHWLTWMVYAIWTSTFGVMLGSISPSSFSIGLILSLLWNVINALSWALVPWPSMPQPFHTFFSFISPLRWFFGALMESALSPMKITCLTQEISTFNIPDGQTCQAYAATFMETAAGYLTNPDGTGSCGYCQMSVGSDYVAALGYAFSHRWRDWGTFLFFFVSRPKSDPFTIYSKGIFLVMCTSNIMVAFLFTWVLRIRPLYS
ncbi:hypothetical protein P7C70_g4898, partial [Phenoliferia sp. Uapishka_3]